MAGKKDDVKGVPSVNPVEEPPVDEIPQATSAGGPVGMIHSFLTSASHGVKDLFSKSTKTIAHGVSGGVGKIAAATNLSKPVVGVALSAALALGGVGGLMTYHSYKANEALLRQEDDGDDCAEAVEDSKVTVDAGPSGTMEEYAAKAWAVAKAIGLSDEQAAGMLGNIEGEAGFDPTTVETIYDEPFDITAPKKAAAVKDLCAFMRTTLRQKYINSGFHVKAHTTKAGCTIAAGGSGTGINSSAYEGVDGHFFPGIGLFGFTGPEGNALVEYANSASGYEWWDFDLQMAFIIDETGGYGRAEWLHNWVGQSCSSPEDAASQFNIGFEGNASNFRGDVKGQHARDWYNKFKGTSGDTSYAQSIIALANTIQGGSQSAAYEKEVDECAEAEETSANNSDLARAAVAYAYETKDEGRGNNGTDLYQFVHDAVYPGDGYYQSCDRGVACAVRWSGTDDDFLAGATDNQDVYLADSPNWEFVGTFDELGVDNLQPGDILVTIPSRRGSAHGHIVVYVSNEIVKEKYPNSDASFVSASFEERSPGCETYSGQFQGDGYHVYRNVQKTENSKYTHITDGKNLNDR